MSLVGPRPEVPEFVDLESEAWRRVLSVRPGLTDPVSIRLRDESAWLEEIGGNPTTAYREHLLPWKLEGYIDYLAQRTAWKDLAVLWQTLGAVLFTRSAQPDVSEVLHRRPGHSEISESIDSTSRADP